MRRALPLLVAWLLAAAPVVASEQDKDLDLIPDTLPAPTTAPAASPALAGSAYLENAFSVSIPRSPLLVRLPPPTPGSWNDRLFLDLRQEWRLTGELTATYSGRLNLRSGNDVPFPSHQGVRNDLREAFLSWQPAEGTWLDVGRINVKSGVATGYNPTDFFRTRAVVEPLTADPRVLREDRFGALMVMGQHVWAGGSVTAAYAPRVTLPTAVYSNATLPVIDPMLDRTNAADRLLLKGSLQVADGFDPELLLYHEGTRTQVGANLTADIGRQMVAYLEWAGGVRASLLHDALRYGVRTGTLPSDRQSVLPVDGGEGFMNDVAMGFSYAMANRVTVNLEYHYHQAGLSAADWRNWFNTGARLGGVPGVTSALWYIRGYAAEQQEPMSRHRVFVRADWVDAFVTDLELSGLAGMVLADGSGFVQVTADYHVSRAWTLGVLGSATFGTGRSEFGSLSQAGSALVRVARYF